MKAQASIELLLMFLLALALAGAASASLMAMRSSASERMDDILAVRKAQSLASAADAAMLGGGGIMPGYPNGQAFRIQGGSLLIRHEGKSAEARGVFIDDPDEPA